MWLNALNGFVEPNKNEPSIKPVFPRLSLGTSWNRTLKTNSIFFTIYDISNTKGLSAVSYEQSSVYSACREIIVDYLTFRSCTYGKYFPLLLTLPTCVYYNNLIINNLEIILKVVNKELAFGQQVDETYSMFRCSSNFMVLLSKDILYHPPLLSIVLLLLKIACIHSICKGSLLYASSSDASNGEEVYIIRCIYELYKNNNNLTEVERNSIANLSLFDFDLEKIMAKVPSESSFGYGFLKFSNNI